MIIFGISLDVQNLLQICLQWATPQIGEI